MVTRIIQICRINSKILLNFRSRKGLTPSELQNALEQVVRDLAEEREADMRVEPVFEFDSDDSDSEIDEEEVITQDSYSSDSEQSAEEVDDIVSNDDEQNQLEDDYRFFIGRDNETLWRSKPISVGKTPVKNIIKVLPGPKSNARNIHTEIDAFRLFITDQMIDNIVINSNIYIEKKRHDVNYSRERDCRVTSENEIRALLGALYLIGIKKGSHTACEELWESDGTGMILLRALFSYKRFRFLLRALRFDNLHTREERKQNDKLAPIRYFHDSFVNNCMTHFNLSEYVTIDEMLHAFRGRCSFVQYIPNKPAKYGLKIYALCDAKTFYTFNFEIYCGKQVPGPYLKSNKSEDIVKRLVAPIEKSKRNVTTDNYYTSYPLANYLLTKGLTLLGTLKKNKREIPVEFQPNKNRELQSSLFGFQDDVCLVSTIPKKNKAVIFLSTMHNSSDVDDESKKPLVNLDYNSTKGGVDTVDQMCASYSTSRITRRWPLALFFRHLDICGINSRVIFKFNNVYNKESRRVFLKNLALQLMENHLKDRAKLQSLPKDVYAFLSKYRDNELQTKAPTRQGICHICGSHKNNRTKLVCQHCGNNVCKNHIAIKCLECEQAEQEQAEQEQMEIE